MRTFIPRSSRLSLVVRPKRVCFGTYRGSPRLYHQRQYVQPQTYYPQSFSSPNYYSDIPWTKHSRWVRWPSYLCAVGIVGWWGLGFWHIEKTSFSNRRRLMFYSQKDMAEMQQRNELTAASMLGLFPLDMSTYFETAKHVLNEAEKEKLTPVFMKLLIQGAMVEKYRGKDLFPFSLHVVEEDQQFSVDHSFWPGRMFITSIGLKLLAVDEVGFATIISHSFAHSLLNHRGEMLSIVKFEEGARYPVPVLVLLAIASKQMRIPAAIYCLGAGALYVYSHQWHENIVEKEADIWSLGVMKLAGYDVTKATQYWERKMDYTQALVDNAKIQRGIVDASIKKSLDQFIEHYGQEVKDSKQHIATIQKYIKDNGILPSAAEEPKTTEDPPKPTEPDDVVDSDVPESKQ
ncbi:hypothetical protein EAF04_000827 [Stromatinia cepivora]|nr:hypothetical protein EAF04_000827 [Stromatinia cepivora]